MPELPEVETVARQLRPILRGRILRRLEILDPKLTPGAIASAAGRRVADVSRLGKMIALELARPRRDDAPRWIVVHLRMTGRLIWRATGGESPPPSERAPRARLHFDGGVVEFMDTRRFGVLRLLRSLEESGVSGLDPMSRRFTTARLRALLRDSRQPIKPWLLRQDRLLGVGNIYASEILFAAGVDPRRAAGALSEEEAAAIHHHARRILRDAIRWCGVTFSDFQDSRGVSGSYGRHLQVYGRGGQSCPRCGGALRRLVQQQRSGFFCPGCQR